jgi:hypothetical protein
VDAIKLKESFTLKSSEIIGSEVTVKNRKDYNEKQSIREFGSH